MTKAKLSHFWDMDSPFWGVVNVCFHHWLERGHTFSILHATFRVRVLPEPRVVNLDVARMRGCEVPFMLLIVE